MLFFGFDRLKQFDSDNLLNFPIKLNGLGSSMIQTGAKALFKVDY